MKHIRVLPPNRVLHRPLPEENQGRRLSAVFAVVKFTNLIVPPGLFLLSTASSLKVPLLLSPSPATWYCFGQTVA